ncbi:MAG: hypothetical protein AAGI46_16610, partial [Planctomycetota bacterium]
MISQTPFQQFLAPRLRTMAKRIRSTIWEPVDTATAVARTEATHEHRFVVDVSEDDFAPVDLGKLPLTWGRKFQQCWWRIELPTLEGRHYLKWDDEGEATLYRRHGEG